MKIIGVGVDLVDNTRIKKSIKNKNFISRIFSTKEINQSKKIKDKTNYYSKRFAAKESLSKAIGTGFRNNLNFKDITIVSDKYGKPRYELNNKVKKLIYAIEKSVRIKSKFIKKDERETSKNLYSRALLNFGHTVGHALESSNNYKSSLTHGEAIAIGMVIESKISFLIGKLPYSPPLLLSKYWE